MFVKFKCPYTLVPPCGASVFSAARVSLIISRIRTRDLRQWHLINQQIQFKLGSSKWVICAGWSQRCRNVSGCGRVAGTNRCWYYCPHTESWEDEVFGLWRWWRHDSFVSDHSATLSFCCISVFFLFFFFALIEVQTAEREVEFTKTRSFHNRHFRWMFWELVIRWGHRVRSESR